MYRVFLERAAERNLKQLSARVHARVIAAIQSAGKEPASSRLPQTDGTDDDWRIRVGDYRVIYEIDDAAGVVRVNRVRHRREVYR